MGHQWTPIPELGVIGLRLDHLSRHAATRAAVVNLLTQPNADPLDIAQAIPVGGTTVNVFDDDISSFANALDAVEPGAGASYRADAANLRRWNQDKPQDRSKFKEFWIAAQRDNPALVAQMRGKLLRALQSQKPVQFMWDCRLPGGSPPEGEHLELPDTFQVLFRTERR